MLPMQRRPHRLVVAHLPLCPAGNNFVNFNTLMCKFGTAVTGGSWLSTTTITCAAPAQALTTVTVEMSNNNLDFTTNGATYQYIPNANVTGIVPSTGPQRGGYVVTAVGNNFATTGLVYCRFNSGIYPATVSSSSQLTCIAPAAPGGLMSVEVSNNYVDFTHSQFNITVYTDETISSLYPVSGSVDGGTYVTVVGTNFLSTAVCKFGGATANVSTIIQSSTLLICLSPSTPASTVSVVVSNNNYTFTTTAVLFTYYPVPSVLASIR